MSRRAQPAKGRPDGHGRERVPGRGVGVVPTQGHTRPPPQRAALGGLERDRGVEVQQDLSEEVHELGAERRRRQVLTNAHGNDQRPREIGVPHEVCAEVVVRRPKGAPRFDAQLWTVETPDIEVHPELERVDVSTISYTSASL